MGGARAEEAWVAGARREVMERGEMARGVAVGAVVGRALMEVAMAEMMVVGVVMEEATVTLVAMRY